MVCEKNQKKCTNGLFDTVQTVQKVLGDDISIQWIYPLEDPICIARCEDVERYGARVCIQINNGKMYNYHSPDLLMTELLIKDAFWGVELNKRVTILTAVGLPVVKLEGKDYE